jgi:hypothetical protein
VQQLPVKISGDNGSVRKIPSSSWVEKWLFQDAIFRVTYKHSIGMIQEYVTGGSREPLVVFWLIIRILRCWHRKYHILQTSLHHWHDSPLWAIAFLGFSDSTILTGWGCQHYAQLPTWRTRPPYLWPPEIGWPSYTSRHGLTILVTFYDTHELCWNYSYPPVTTRRRQTIHQCQISISILSKERRKRKQTIAVSRHESSSTNGQRITGDNTILPILLSNCCQRFFISCRAVNFQPFLDCF